MPTHHEGPDIWGDMNGYFEACRPKLRRQGEQFGASIDSRLQVAVRCRPLDARERNLGDKDIVATQGDGTTVTLNLRKLVQGTEAATFAFDHVYGPESR